jgi:hypothetical protein|tara:strand:+ start:5494 stop:5643 length:150 start_codon:yes stop_codon:yes gene_type:complete
MELLDADPTTDWLGEQADLDGIRSRCYKHDVIADRQAVTILTDLLFCPA